MTLTQRTAMQAALNALRLQTPNAVPAQNEIASAAIRVLQSALAEPDVPEGWIRIEDKFPSIGEKCLVCIKGVVLHEVYVYDESDECSPYWSRDDLDECPFVDNDHLWMPLPTAPEVSK